MDTTQVTVKSKRPRSRIAACVRRDQRDGLQNASDRHALLLSRSQELRIQHEIPRTHKFQEEKS